MTASKMATRTMLFSTILLLLVSVAVSAPAPHPSTNYGGFVGLETHKPAHNGTSGRNSTAPPPRHPNYCCCHICCMTKKCHSANATYADYNLTSDYKSFSGGYRPPYYKGAGNERPVRSTASTASLSGRLFVAPLVALSIVVVFGA
ncbi:hypothetical protein HD806DRAFT_552685 [Xylariaceae sp. AK1471]|nr:hypothetical protein HD806DRAFT_552685 [Xylariaceae sp. AK1471]